MAYYVIAWHCVLVFVLLRLHTSWWCGLLCMRLHGGPVLLQINNNFFPAQCHVIRYPAIFRHATGTGLLLISTLGDTSQGYTYLNSCTFIFGLHVDIIDTYSNDVMVICTYIESNV